MAFTSKSPNKNLECNTCVPTTKSVPKTRSIEEIKQDECKSFWQSAEKCMVNSESTDWRVCKEAIYSFRKCQVKAQGIIKRN